MHKSVYQLSVKIADLDASWCCDQEDSKAKVRNYSKAMLQGDIFPPLFLIETGGEFAIHDGNHRVSAAALAGLDAVDAVVLSARSVDEELAISEAFFKLDFSVDHEEDKPDWRDVESIELSDDPKVVVREVSQSDPNS